RGEGRLLLLRALGQVLGHGPGRGRLGVIPQPGERAVLSRDGRAGAGEGGRASELLRAARHGRGPGSELLLTPCRYLSLGVGWMLLHLGSGSAGGVSRPSLAIFFTASELPGCAMAGGSP